MKKSTYQYWQYLFDERMTPPPPTSPLPCPSFSVPRWPPPPYYTTTPPSSPHDPTPILTSHCQVDRPPPLTTPTPLSPILTSQCLCVDDQACPEWPAFWGSWTARYTGLPWRHTQCVSWSSSGTLDQFLHTWSPVGFQSSYRALIQTVMNIVT